MQSLKKYRSFALYCRERLNHLFQTGIYIGRSPFTVPDGSIVFFPCRFNTLFCGLAGIVAFKRKKQTGHAVDLASMQLAVDNIENHGFDECYENNIDLGGNYLCGDSRIEDLLNSVRALKENDSFCVMCESEDTTASIRQLSDRLNTLIEGESQLLARQMGHLPTETVDVLSRRLENLKDIAWCFSSELLENIQKKSILYSLSL